MAEFEYDPKIGCVTFFNVNLTQFFTKYNIFYCRVDLKMATWPVFVKPDLKFAIPRTVDILVFIHFSVIALIINRGQGAPQSNVLTFHLDWNCTVGQYNCTAEAATGTVEPVREFSLW
jgi:hypothetical protein